MRLSIPAILLLSALVCASKTLAQPHPLANALAAALEYDPQYQAALQRSIAKTEQLEISTSRLRPAVGISSNRLQVDQRVQTAASAAQQQNYPSKVDSLVLRQSLYQPQLAAEKEQANYNMQAARAQLTAAHQALVFRLATAYAAVVKEMRKSELMAGQLAVLELRRAAAEKAVLLGTGIGAERDEILAQATLLRVERIKSHQAQDIARTELTGITGWASPQLDEMFKSIDTTMPYAATPLEPLESWLERVQNQSPSMQDALMQVQALHIGVKAAEAVRHPTLDLIAQINKTQGENSFFVTSRTQSQSLGLQLYIPISQGAGEWARQRMAVAQLKEGQANAEQVRNTLISNTRKAYFSIEEFQARAHALQQVQGAARQTAQVNKRAYEAGYKTLLDVVSSEQRLLEVQLESLDVQANLWLAQLQLRTQAALADFN